MNEKSNSGLFSLLIMAGVSVIATLLFFASALNSVFAGFLTAGNPNRSALRLIAPLLIFAFLYSFFAQRVKTKSLLIFTTCGLVLFAVISLVVWRTTGAYLPFVPIAMVVGLIFSATFVRNLIQLDRELKTRLEKIKNSEHFAATLNADSRVDSGLRLLQTVLPVKEIIVFVYGQKGELNLVGRIRDQGKCEVSGESGISWKNNIAFCEAAIHRGETQFEYLDENRGSARIGIPLASDDAVIGGYFVEIAENFEVGDLTLLNSFGEQLARSFQRKQLIAADSASEKSIGLFSGHARQNSNSLIKLIGGLIAEQSFASCALGRISDAHAIAYLDGTLGFVSKAMRIAANIVEDDLQTLDLFELLSKFKNDVFVDPAIPIRRVLQTGNTFSVELNYPEDETTLEMEIKLVNSAEQEPKPVCFLVSVRDISVKKENEKLRSDMVNLISHELRTPITSIRGFAEIMLMEESLGEESKEYLAMIASEATRASNLLTNFLSVANLQQSDKQELHHSAVRIDRIVGDVVETMKEPARQKRIRIIEKNPPFVPTISVDRGLITKAISLLVDNALKYSPERSSVIISTLMDSDFLQVEVEDRGYGIPTEEQEKIWTKFYRVARDGHDKEGASTGLGLSIVKEIIECHRGSVTVESEVGHGSKFSFKIPRL